MDQNVITDVQVTMSKMGNNHSVHVKITYVRSTISSGRRMQHLEVYDRLTREEMVDVVDVSSAAWLPGDELHFKDGAVFAQPRLFDI